MDSMKLLMQDVQKINTVLRTSTCKECGKKFNYYAGSNRGGLLRTCLDCKVSDENFLVRLLICHADEYVELKDIDKTLTDLSRMFGKRNLHNIAHGNFGFNLNGLVNSKNGKVLEHPNSSMQVCIDFCIRYKLGMFTSQEEMRIFLHRYLSKVRTTPKANRKLRHVQNYETDMTVQLYTDTLLLNDGEQLMFNNQPITHEILDPFILKKTRL